MFAIAIDRQSLVLTAWLLLAGAGAAWAHVDSPYLTDKCGSCHVGHGESGQPMLAEAEERFCYQCHGADEVRSRMVESGRLLPGARLQDMRSEFQKSSGHPVEHTGGHSPTERLPSFTGSEVTHAECVDCHNPHERIAGEKSMNFAVKGYSLTGQYLERSTFQYEICLKCHNDRLAGKSGAIGLMSAFATSVRSQHPVSVPSTGKRLPSLRESMAAGTVMKCSECHRSDDPNAPRGPHGSNYDFLLPANYDRGLSVMESSLAYEFCYGCHDRQSLLRNDSFPFHRQHIEGDLVTGRLGTSCFTCHASHGSPDYLHLIAFNAAGVTRTDSGQSVRYSSFGEGSGTCVLKCHGHNHEPGEY